MKYKWIKWKCPNDRCLLFKELLGIHHLIDQFVQITTWITRSVIALQNKLTSDPSDTLCKLFIDISTVF